MSEWWCCTGLHWNTTLSVVYPLEQLVYLVWKPTHEDTVSCQLTHVTGTQFPHLSSNAVLLHQRLLGPHKHKQTNTNKQTHTCRKMSHQPHHFSRCFCSLYRKWRSCVDSHKLPSYWPWWSGTEEDHQWTERSWGLGTGTLAVGCDGSSGTDCCYSVVTWQCQFEPGSKDTAGPVPGGYQTKREEPVNIIFSAFFHSALHHELPEDSSRLRSPVTHTLNGILYILSHRGKLQDNQDFVRRRLLYCLDL